MARHMSKEELHTFLHSNPHVRLHDFGQGIAKREEDLAREYDRREIRLSVRKRRIIRSARTMRLRIESAHPVTGKQLVLKELYHMSRFHGNSLMTIPGVRTRYFEYGASVSETMLFGEYEKAAALRAIEQELGISHYPRSRLQRWKAPKREQHESTAYPGIISDVRCRFMYTWFQPEHFKPSYLNFEEDGTWSIFGWMPVDEEVL